jgi:serine phosphatase RsbU (regulator of sigma subunit)
MQCLEVWGGNQPVDAGVAMTGLDAWVYCKPYHDADAGGDVYYVSACATGRITRLLVADVSGHGERVGAVGKTLRTMMRRYVNYIDQRSMVRTLNREFTALNNLGCFATAIVCTFFGPTRHLTLCNAGHPPPLLYQAKRRQWLMLERTGTDRNIPWGIDDVCNYDQFDVRLNVGDLVLCHTDSLSEARRPDGELLGMPGLLRIISSLDVTDGSKLTAALLTAIEAEGYRTDDDVTVLLFRPNGASPRLNFIERWRVQGRMAKALFQSLLPGGGPMPWPDLRPANIGGVFFSSLNKTWGPRMMRRQIAEDDDEQRG